VFGQNQVRIELDSSLNLNNHGPHLSVSRFLSSNALAATPLLPPLAAAAAPLLATTTSVRASHSSDSVGIFRSIPPLHAKTPAFLLLYPLSSALPPFHHKPMTWSSGAPSLHHFPSSIESGNGCTPSPRCSLATTHPRRTGEPPTNSLFPIFVDHVICHAGNNDN
jgi:hypothetical protein